MFAVLVGSLILGGLASGGAYLYLDFAQNVPAVQDMGAYFGGPGAQGFVPIRLYDRTGQHFLGTLSNDAAADAHWMTLDPAGVHPISQVVIKATLAAQQPDFWQASPQGPGKVLVRLIADVLPIRYQAPPLSLAEAVAEHTLLPLEVGDGGGVRRDFRLALLGERLSETYSKEQILTWYLNSAYYGHQASGIDAAALVYFGKHAEDLDLAESAMLAAIPTHPDINPLDKAIQARQAQRQVLDGMVALRLIDKSEASRAAAERLRFMQPHSTTGDLARLVGTRLVALFGDAVLQRGGLEVVTSIDLDLQLQAACTLTTHLAHLRGNPTAQSVPAADGSPCLAAGFLPPVRPADLGTEHNVSSGVVVITDPKTSEVLALAVQEGAGPGAESLLPAGDILAPFVYLTAFSRGYTPASMVLDIPEGSTGASDADAHGPVRMRTALVNGFPAALARTLDLVGIDNVANTARQMGLGDAYPGYAGQGPAVESSDRLVSLLDLTAAYGIMANEGQMVGSAYGAQLLPGQPGSLTLILGVQDIFGRRIESKSTRSKSVLSAQLAYLMNDVLSDDVARQTSYGTSDPLQVGRPAAGFSGLSPEGDGSWTVGYSPDKLVGVWIGNPDGRKMSNVNRLNGSAPIWHAVFQYAAREDPPAGWDQPPGMSEVAVCDPSGLLPTPYCPNVVRELFIQGTEPTTYDSLYRPFKVDRETGKLATLFTPVGQVDQKVFMVPPPGAAEWAKLSGIQQPPDQYDPVNLAAPPDPSAQLSNPVAFAVLAGRVSVQGLARSSQFESYRLQYGAGLNPDRWFQIGNDVKRQVSDGYLGTWDTSGLNGLYTLQLIVVNNDGQIHWAAVPVTLDNTPPSVSILSPLDGETLSLAGGGRPRFEAAASDDSGVARVIFEIDGAVVGQAVSQPYSFLWTSAKVGTHRLVVVAEDELGNRTETSTVQFTVTP